MGGRKKPKPEPENIEICPQDDGLAESDDLDWMRPHAGIRLVGDIRVHRSAHPADYGRAFLQALEELMVKHKVSKIDVGWSGPFDE